MKMTATMRRWPPVARAAFRRVYAELVRDQRLVHAHPKATPIPREQWRVLCWNAAWTVADEVAQAIQASRR